MNYSNKNSLKKQEMVFYSIPTSLQQVLFGGYPREEELTSLKELGVVYIIDLTTPFEKKKLQPYNAKEYNMTYVNFPIYDNFIPVDIEKFHEFMSWLMFMIGSLKTDEKVYIHCRGGHGRSGMIVASLLCIMHNKTPAESIEEITIAHRERPILSPKWKTRLCPSNHVQRVFLHNMYDTSCSLRYNIEQSLYSTRRRLLEKYMIAT